MALDRLAPDQRAVVQLVLQQERSYDELADLLGIPVDAVRERARQGLERLDWVAGLEEDDRARITDYLLGQQTVSEREATRELLSTHPNARAWARSIAGELASVARSPLPEVPETAPAPAEPPAAAEPAAAPAVATPAVEPEPATTVPGTSEPARPVRARPRPPRADAPRREPDVPGPGPERPRSSVVGGALLIGGIGLVLAALVAWLIWGGDDEGERDGGQAATPTATATATVQPAGQIELRQPGGGDARGQMTVFVSDDGQIAFTIEGRDMPELDRGEAYAMWLTGGKRPRRLGFITDDDPDDGNIGSSGPQESDAAKFPQWLADATQVIVTRETTQEGEEPGAVVLRGSIRRAAGG